MADFDYSIDELRKAIKKNFSRSPLLDAQKKELVTNLQKIERDIMSMDDDSMLEVLGQLVNALERRKK